MNTDYERIRVCSFHEAGHTVAFLEHGVALKHVTITVPGFFSDGSGYTLPKTGQIPYEADMICTIAGTVAEQMLYDEWGHSTGKAKRLAAPGVRGTGGDLEIIMEIQQYTTYTLADAEKAARTLLMNNWQRVQRTAEEIARYGKVPGHRLARIG
ncbi:hypothetical protein BAY61_31760 (plasmid) [Prauserella marina]|uniref:Peptidase family M41 n=1 Tax=Prauserella marina TaxID=530584 RepID=A0A222W0X8_9PSEU|nr:hypothetical protein [Prauserella marina]ASR39864.1 hypothetical protein BAY61_31760 [Prauserella marina]PWV71356.1 peptidase M41-like protein [Prauserella marina]SDD95902.1 Peptidase family M41 [Prauserella marina]